MDSLIDKIYQNAIEIQSKALQTIALINQIRSNQDNIVAVKFDNFSQSKAESNLAEVQFNALLELQKIAKNVQLNAPQNTENLNETIENLALNFTNKEINSMPKEIKKQFKLGRIRTGIRRKENGSYEIRCRINGIDFSATSKFLDEAKLKFIEKLKDYSKNQQIADSVSAIKLNKALEHRSEIIFKDYTLKWLEVAKKPYIKETTYKSYLESFNFHIFPKFGNRDLRTIKQLEIQAFINEFENRKRTAKKLYQLLSAIFDYAVIDEIISRSPMAKVRIPVYEQIHGTPLTRSEEKIFVDNLKNNNEELYLQAFVFILYTGLRRSELSSVKIDDTWVTVTTGKQRKGKSEKRRRIPISPMLKKVLPLIDVNGITALKNDPLTRHFKLMSPNHHLHDLRHTFITRCQECGIQREIVSLWAGHAADSSITSVVYTHLERFEDNQIKEIQKYSYIL